MKTDKIKDLWKSAGDALNKQSLDPHQIDRFKKLKTQSNTKKLYLNYVVNVILEFAVIAAVLVTLYLYRNIPGIMVFELFCIIITGFFAIYHCKKLRFLKNLDITSENLNEVLQQKISFLKTSYQKALIFFALSYTIGLNAFHLLYFYKEYGGLRKFDLEDAIVFTLSYLIMFSLFYFVNRYRINVNIREYETYLEDIDSENIKQIKKNEKKFRRFQAMIIILLFIGVLAGVVTYFMYAG